MFRINGVISASNYIAIPASRSAFSASSNTTPNNPNLLGLTGEYAYLQLRVPLPSKSGGGLPKLFTFHINARTDQPHPHAICLSFSNIFKEVKLNGRVLQLPLTIEAGKWAVVVVHLPSLIADYTPFKYSSLCSLQLCANLSVRNVWTTDTLYQPESLPREMRLPTTKHQEWASRYQFLLIGRPPAPVVSALSSPNHSPESKHSRTRISVPTAPVTPGHNANGAPVPRHAPKPSPHPTSQGRRPAQSRLQQEVASHAEREILRKPTPQLLQSDAFTGEAMKLSRVIGLSAATGPTPLWCPDGVHVLYSCDSVVVLMNTRTMQQHFLLGHTQPIACMKLSSQNILATAQQGRNPVVRLWDLSGFPFEAPLPDVVNTGVAPPTPSVPVNAKQSPLIPCLSCLRQHHFDMRALAFSSRGELLAAAGKDAQSRILIVVWDVSQALDDGRVVLVARQLSEFDVTKLAFSPYPEDPFALVSCGNQSIRFWRLRKGHLPAASLVLGEHVSNRFTDLAFEATYGPADHQNKRLYVSTASGRLFQVHYTERRLECVYQLHSGPIRSLSINEGFCATGSDDGFLRLWPLDFSDYYLQAQHKASVTGLRIAQGGLTVLVATANGTLGVLDISTSAYKTLLRSHTDTIKGLAVDTFRPECCTASEDGTLRVWDLATLEQRYEFLVPDDKVTSVACCPSRSTHMLAAGFKSGCVRVLDVESTSLFIDFQQHRGAVQDVLYSPDGAFLYSSGSDFTVCCYDVADGYQPIRVFQCYRDNQLPPELVLPTPPTGPEPLPAFTSTSAATSRGFFNDAKSGARISKVAWKAAEAKRDHRERDRALLALEEREKKARERAAKPARNTHSLAINHNGSLIARIAPSPDVCVVVSTHDMQEAKRFRSCGARISEVRFVAPSASEAGCSGGELLLVLHDDTVQRFDLSSGRLLSDAQISQPHPSMSHQITPQHTPVQCLAATNSPDGKYIASTSTTLAIKLAPRLPRQIPRTRSQHSNHPLSLLGKAPGLHHGAQSYMGHWGGTGKGAEKLAWPESLQFTPDGRHLISTCGTAVFIWELRCQPAQVPPVAAASDVKISSPEGAPQGAPEVQFEPSSDAGTDQGASDDAVSGPEEEFEMYDLESAISQQPQQQSQA